MVTKIVQREVEVPGKVIRVPKPHTVDRKIIVPRFLNEELPMVVNQLIEPIIYESAEDYAAVTLKDYQPYLVPIDVYLPVPVEREFIPVKQSHSHRTVDVSPSQYNALVKTANLGATDKEIHGLLVKQIDGCIPMLNTPDLRVITPMADDWKATHAPSQIHVEGPTESFIRPSLAD